MGSEQNLTEDDGSARLADLAAAMMTQTVPECTSHRESPLFAADRGAYWESLRSLGPVVKVAGANVYYLTRRDDILQAARDPYTFSSSWPALPVVNASGDPLPRVPLSCPPREHLRYARILHRLFAPSVLAPYEHAVRERAEVLIDAVAPTGRCDVTGAIAYIWPSQAFLTVMGVPVDHPAGVAGWMQEGSHNDGDSQFGLLNWLAATIAEHFDRRPPGLLWRLLEDLDAGNFTTDEMLGLLVTLFISATAGVTDALGHALWRLARHPRLRTQLRGDLKQIEAFVGETLRLDVAAPLPRVTTKSVTIGGVMIEPGAHVLLPLDSANREDAGDEMAEDDGRVQVQRHSTFGAGPYRCPGSVLARMEVTVFVDEWLRRIPEFDVEQGFTPAIRLPGLALASLPLCWAPA